MCRFGCGGRLEHGCWFCGFEIPSKKGSVSIVAEPSERFWFGGVPAPFGLCAVARWSGLWLSVIFVGFVVVFSVGVWTVVQV